MPAPVECEDKALHFNGDLHFQLPAAADSDTFSPQRDKRMQNANTNKTRSNVAVAGSDLQILGTQLTLVKILQLYF